MSKDELIRQLQISCLGLDAVDPLRLLVDDVIEALAQTQRTWVGLTAPEQTECYDLNPARFANNIEAKLKEKNT